VLVIFSLLIVAGCGRGLKPKTPEEAATLWGQLICDRRGDLLNIQFKELQKRQENEVVHQTITTGDAQKNNRLDEIEELLTFIRDHREAIDSCVVDVVSTDARDDRHVAEVSVTFQQIRWPRGDEGKLELIDHKPKMEIELVEVDGAWRVAKEATNKPRDPALSLVTRR